MTPASPWRTGVMVVLTLAVVVCSAAAAVAISRTPGARLADLAVGSRQADAPGASSAPIASSAAAASEPSSVTIAAGDSAAVIGRRLLTGRAIDSQTRFGLLAALLGWESRLEPGSYSFEPGLTTFEILRRIHFGETSPLRVVIPEGLRLEQVTERLAEANVVDGRSFAAALQTAATSTAAGSPASPPSLAAQRPPGTSLEGYLFPSAYSFPLGTTADDALALILLRFNDSITPLLREQINASGRTLHEVLTVASIIEREVVEDAERPLVSAVIRNRLDAAMPLQMDSTVQYAVGTAAAWWKRELSAADLEVDSPYNTYRYRGLPPTPIASPGLASIEAAVNPANVPYLFFFARGDGSHAFAVTYEEHQANVERYRGGSE